ncbi:molecular chaperone DnaJ [Ligilactobacillus equi]|nr:molecular chaperone DnaJ [Ligilactobacillus equi]KRL77184.1 chaperone protein dnaj [Ligilactobacillus equi DSM 15833 = JCM 10991]
MAEQRDPYEVLGVSKDASQADIKRAYRRLSKKYHPDLNQEPGAEEKFKEVNDAYEILGDEQKKAQYDQYGFAGSQGGFGGGQGYGGFSGFGGGQDFGGFEDIFSSFFGGGGSSARSANAPRQGRDMQYTMNLKFEEAIFGKKSEIQYSREQECHTCGGNGAKPGTSPQTCRKCGGRGFVQVERQTPLGRMMSQQECDVCHGSGQEITDKCPTCHGSGHEVKQHAIEVTVPAGVEDGNQLRLQGQGGAGENGGPYGDLYIVFRVAPSDKFEREGSEIYFTLPLSFAQVALGDEVKVPTVHGEVSLKIPAGTQTGTVFRLRGKGAPYLRGSGTGDQRVTVVVQTPKNLNKAQRDALQAFADASGEDPSGDDSVRERVEKFFNKKKKKR